LLKKVTKYVAIYRFVGAFGTVEFNCVGSGLLYSHPLKNSNYRVKNLKKEIGEVVLNLIALFIKDLCSLQKKI
jgi:hypothetical protein